MLEQAQNVEVGVPPDPIMVLRCPFTLWRLSSRLFKRGQIGLALPACQRVVRLTGDDESAFVYKGYNVCVYGRSISWMFLQPH